MILSNKIDCHIDLKSMVTKIKKKIRRKLVARDLNFILYIRTDNGWEYFNLIDSLEKLGVVNTIIGDNLKPNMLVNVLFECIETKKTNVFIVKRRKK